MKSLTKTSIFLVHVLKHWSPFLSWPFPHVDAFVQNHFSSFLFLLQVWNPVLPGRYQVELLNGSMKDFWPFFASEFHRWSSASSFFNIALVHVVGKIGFIAPRWKKLLFAWLCMCISPNGLPQSQNEKRRPYWNFLFTYFFNHEKTWLQLVACSFYFSLTWCCFSIKSRHGFSLSPVFFFLSFFLFFFGCWFFFLLINKALFVENKWRSQFAIWSPRLYIDPNVCRFCKVALQSGTKTKQNNKVEAKHGSECVQVLQSGTKMLLLHLLDRTLQFYAHY